MNGIRPAARRASLVMLTVLALAPSFDAAALAGDPAGGPLTHERAAHPAVTTHLAGYVWSTSVTAATLDTYYAFNGSGGGFTQTNPTTAMYYIAFANLGGITHPVIDITPYGTQALCGRFGQLSVKGNYEVGVECFSPGGAAQESVFDLIVAQPASRPRGVLDYATVLASGRLAQSLGYNSSHKPNHAMRLGAGRYVVRMPGPSAKGTTGTVKVSDYEATPGTCEVAGWHGTRTGQVIDVDCFSAAGAMQNRTFTVSYVKDNNLMGLNGATTADAYANRPDKSRYQPTTQYDSHRGARVTVKRLSRGSYRILLTGSAGPWHANGGDIQVSAVGTTDHRCVVDFWAQEPGGPLAAVSCINQSGHPADSRFTIQWVVA